MKQAEMKTEIDQLLDKLEEVCKQLNQAKAKETKMTNCNKLQDQAQKVQALFMFLYL